MLRDDVREMGEEAFVDDLERILNSGRHLLELVNEVLDLSKIEAGRMDLNPETFAVAPVIRATADTVRPVVEKRHTLELDMTDDLGEMYADETKLKQSLNNLLSNSGKFTENGRDELLAEVHERVQEVQAEQEEEGATVPTPGPEEASGDEETEAATGEGDGAEPSSDQEDDVETQHGASPDADDEVPVETRDGASPRSRAGACRRGRFKRFVLRRARPRGRTARVAGGRQRAQLQHAEPAARAARL
jgi:hypothetical protein